MYFTHKMHFFYVFFQKNPKKSLAIQYFCVTLHPQSRNKVATSIRSLSSAGSERLPYKQRVGGSNPSATTMRKHLFQLQSDNFQTVQKTTGAQLSSRFLFPLFIPTNGDAGTSQTHRLAKALSSSSPGCSRCRSRLSSCVSLRSRRLQPPTRG